MEFRHHTNLSVQRQLRPFLTDGPMVIQQDWLCKLKRVQHFGQLITWHILWLIFLVTYFRASLTHCISFIISFIWAHEGGWQQWDKVPVHKFSILNWGKDRPLPGISDLQCLCYKLPVEDLSMWGQRSELEWWAYQVILKRNPPQPKTPVFGLVLQNSWPGFHDPSQEERGTFAE